MAFAARLTDPVEHSNELTGLLVGAVVGLAVGVAIVGTGGAALVVVATVGATVCTGAGVGQLVGSLDAVNSRVGGTVTGAIASGAGNVMVNGLLAARASSDTVACQGTPPLYLPSHHGTRVAQGSSTIFVNGQPAARIGDKIECGSEISSGSDNVLFGGATQTTVEIQSEVPPWVSGTLMVVGLASAVVLGGPVVAALGFVGGYIGGSGGSWLGGQIFGEGSDGQKIMGFFGGMVGGALGGKLGSTGKLGTWNQMGKCTLGLEPIDLGSGRVVDAEVDITLPGLIACSWGRTYNSGQAHEKSALGRGGWTHTFEQWVVREPGRTSLRDEEGRDVFFPAIDPGQRAFHRSDRITLTALEDGGFEAHSLVTRLTRSFAPLRIGGKAVLQAIRDAHGNAITLHYTGDLLSRIVDTAGRELRVICGHGGRVLRLEVRVGDALEQWVSYDYSDRGHLAGATDTLGHTERYAYDDQHRMAKKTLKNGVSFHYEYDERTGWCCRSWGDGGLHSGRIRVDLEKRITYLEENEEPRILHWNEDGLVVREETPDGILKGTWEYDQDLYLIAEANGAGETKRHEYDARGNRVKEIDAAGNVTEWRYEDDLPAVIVGPDGLPVRYEHDARGLLLEARYPTNLRYALSYDEIGRLRAVREEDTLVRELVYDARHNVVEEIDGRGAKTAYAYDLVGRAISRTDALGRPTFVDYDRLGQPLEVRRPDGTKARSVYDALGNPTRTTDALGQVTEMEYAGTGVLAKLTQPDGRAWAFKYSAEEKLRRITNPRGEEYEFAYDTAGRVTEEATFDGRTLHYGYSAAGRLARIDYPDGSFRAFSHDAHGNVLEEESTDGPIHFQRDRMGRLLGAVVEQDGQRVLTLFQRDRFGRVVAETQGERMLRYEHDARGRRTARVMPDGATTRYEYDALGRLNSVDHDGHELVLERDALGRETARGDAAGRVSIQSGYDAMDRLVEQRVAVPQPGGGTPSVAVERRWRYDALGRVSRIDDAHWGTTAYRYDAIGQLVEASGWGYREVFEHDAAGSIQKMLAGLDTGHAEEKTGKDPWEIATGNLLMRTERAEYAYDRRGRRIAKHAIGEGRAGEKTEYVWDCRDRLRQVKLPSGSEVRFDYDAFGRRVRKEVPSEARKVDFVWDGDVLAADVDIQHGVRCFIYAPGTFVPLLQAEQGEVLSYVNDHLGMPKELIDRAGRVAWSAAHSAWGRVTKTRRDPAAKRVESPFRLLGQYMDVETGLCCTRFRYFDVEVGRWCSPDPLRNHGGFEAYQFNGSPSVVVDPRGLACGPGSAKDPFGPISMEDAVAKAAAHVGEGNVVTTGSGKNLMFMLTELDANGKSVTRIGRFDINPNDTHVQKLGYQHLNIETQVNGKVVLNEHWMIDPSTILPGDY